MSIVALVIFSVSICGTCFSPLDITVTRLGEFKGPSLSESKAWSFSDRDRLALEPDESVTLEANDQITDFPER